MRLQGDWISDVCSSDLRAWRAPTLFELFSNGPHLGEARYEIGDAGLKPEAGTELDGTLRWQGTRGRVERFGGRRGGKVCRSWWWADLLKKKVVTRGRGR